MRGDLRGVVFSDDEVSALCKGKLTQFRRVVDMRPLRFIGGEGHGDDPSAWGVEIDDSRSGWTGHLVLERGRYDYHDDEMSLPCPFGDTGTGTRLYVKERFAHALTRYHDTGTAGDHGGPDDPCCAFSDGTYRCGKPIPQEALRRRWRSGHFMPRQYARFFLEVVSVRVQRVDAAPDEDYTAEGKGVTWGGGCFHRDYVGMWDATHKTGEKWSDRPWTWVVSFRELPA